MKKLLAVLTFLVSAVAFADIVTVPIPVAPVVVCVIFVIAMSTHTDGEDDATPAVFAAVTIIVPVALTVPQPPVKGIS